MGIGGKAHATRYKRADRAGKKVILDELCATTGWLCRVAPVHCCTEAPSEPCVPLVAAHGSSKPQRAFQVRGSTVSPCVCAAVAAVAGGVHKADVVRSDMSVGGQVMPGYRLSGAGEPFFPLSRAGRLPVGVQQVVPAQRTSTALSLQEMQGTAVERGCAPAMPIGPVLGQGRVVRRRRS